jgi:hypothetical protein
MLAVFASVPEPVGGCFRLCHTKEPKIKRAKDQERVLNKRSGGQEDSFVFRAKQLLIS